ncbi:MAG TPA: M14 family metallopeptidase [Gemmatimonadales bacterium]|nr:M14 family metallopeptidase [Gemmatimonadales bacterium]
MLGLLLAGRLQAQTTRPERTAYRETSSYADVLGFLDSLQKITGDIRLGTLATSPEGRAVPYVVAGRPLPASPTEAHRMNKPVVYLQANIHAGEVEGKEAAQMLLRDLTHGSIRSLLDSLILLVVPIYNADGNESLAPGGQNRPGQNGPAVVGRNTNGQGLNLNRDYVKGEAPETRGALALLAAWDPDLFIDLHTTNGSYHGYVLTYAPGLNPNSGPAAEYVRDRFLPTVRQRMEQRHRQRTFSYGNFRNQHPDSLALGWETYDGRARYGTNWMGLRGRLAVLSEGYSNADFKTRIGATYNFVHEVLSLAAEQGRTIKSLILASNRWRPDSVAVRSALAPPTTQDVIAEITAPAGDGSGGFARRRRTGVYRTVRMPVFDRFAAARKEALPAAYLIPPRLAEVVDLLRRQGIGVERLNGAWRASAQIFTVDSLAVSPPFEGHRTMEAGGMWRPQPIDTTLGSGWFLVRTAQPLGVLAGYLLEPASEDGIVTWNLLDRELQPGTAYPIIRVHRPPGASTVAVP